ncbi:MAG TPA: ATP-dependent helicase [Thermodesulfobacteriota bacterium]|nr:ATP-dependent helicase [Thermodesulfobacteriota bacterium]
MNEKILEGLDDAQLRAVMTDSTRVLVVAPPGSGKTRVLASRFARLISEGVEPGKILAVTFTNRAGTEMRDRVGGLAGIEVRDLDIGTLHGFCLKVLKSLRPGLTLYGRAEQREVLRELGVKNPERGIERISFMKNRFPSGAGKVVELDYEVFRLYRERLEREQALDLDDLILEALSALEGGVYSPGFTHIMVDEFQDINPPQARLIKLLALGGARLFAIGDPDQAIYAFRGADVKAFMDFEKEWPGSEVIRLTRNYRSPEKIVAASRALISNNSTRVENEVVSTRGGGEIKLVGCPDEGSLAAFITREVEGLMGGLVSLTVGGGGGREGERDRGGGSFRFSDFAVLYRTRAQAELISGAFGRSSIPCHVVSPPGPGFKEFLEHLRTLGPVPGIPLPDLVEREGRLIGAESLTLELFLRRAGGAGGAGGAGAREGEELESFIDAMQLLEPPDNLDIRADRVNLMTLHMAKGLEFRVVFIAGAEDGFIPMRRGETDVEEERRLFYVGMTRAKEKLYLLHARSRREWGRAEERTLSPFVDEIPEGLIETINLKKKTARRRPAQKGLFE